MMPSIGAVVAIIRHGRILLTKHEDFEAWCLPGGAVEDGESLEQAAAREGFEETGLLLRVSGLVGLYSQPRWHSGGNHFALFAAEPVGGTLGPAPGETIDAGFFERGALPEPLVWWHLQLIADALDGLAGVTRVFERPWPFESQLTRQEIYALRDRSGLPRQQFYRDYFE
ncbi:MAG TPA: NUDIX domain-containing protein [Roseiflexaceae bacterium]|nr:NUDIX domain-containing protein [Roseiflexaceae bacterium]